MTDHVIAILTKKNPDDLEKGEAVMWRIKYETGPRDVFVLACPWCGYVNWWIYKDQETHDAKVRTGVDGIIYLADSIHCHGCPGHYTVAADPDLAGPLPDDVESPLARSVR